MGTTPTVENAVTWFNAHTVTHHLDVVDRQVASIVDTRTVEGSIVRIYNAAGFGFMTLKSDIVSTWFDSLFGEKLVGTRHAEDGRLYAILKDDDCTREESVVLPAGSAVELDVAVSEYGFTSVVEWLHTKSNVFISFYENETSDDPWLRICEPA